MVLFKTTAVFEKSMGFLNALEKLDVCRFCCMAGRLVGPKTFSKQSVNAKVYAVMGNAAQTARIGEELRGSLSEHIKIVVGIKSWNQNY